MESLRDKIFVDRCNCGSGPERGGVINSPLPTRVKILLVFDGRIRLDKNPFDFGLGYALETLRGPIRPWIGFQVDLAKRDGTSTAGDDLNPIKYGNFKFTNPGFDLDSYEQVWFFGDLPNNNDGADGSTDASIPLPTALSDAELKILAEWMDRGGGVFATGDHSILGATLCHRIPRVRTMRRWTHAQGVPTRDGVSRLETLQPRIAPGDPEGDTVLQPVELVYEPISGQFPFAQGLMPHPIMCSRRGAIDHFPDHMHEGEVIGDEDVAIDRPLDIPDYDRPEYPADSVSGKRPRPHVVAYGKTTTAIVVDPTVQARLIPGHAAGDNSVPFGPRRFALVGTYDGDPAGVGRVVVDSTWHHWFSLNLNSIATANSPAYEKMQDYYRNIGLWLARPEHRRSTLVSAIWGVLVTSPPMRFSTMDSPWEIGERVLETLGEAMSPCELDLIVDPLLDQNTRAALSAPGNRPLSEPSWSGLPTDLVNRAFVGGIASALLDLALDHREKRARGERSRLDPEAIRQRAIDGVERGHALLRRSVDDAAAAFGATRDKLATSTTLSSIGLQIPLEVSCLRVIAETLQLPERSDPALIGQTLTLTMRIRVDGVVVACRTFNALELSSFDARGGIVHFNCDVTDVEVQTGESLSIEVLAGDLPSRPTYPEIYRFKETLRGDASNWVGKHAPTRSQAWRLWYRIEKSEQPSYVDGAQEPRADFV